MQEICEIIEGKRPFWKKMNEVRTILMREENLDYGKATNKATRLVRNVERERIAAATSYMNNHLESLNVPEVDDDALFWEVMGVSDEYVKEKISKDVGLYNGPN